MSGTVSTRWYWSDWMSDPGLRACGYAARGLWKDMLCIAGSNKGKDYGFVTLKGRPLDSAGIARMTGGAAAEVETLLDELDRNGVFNKDKRKAIYCRRMVRAEKNRGNGRLGGNPNLLNGKENKNPVQPKPKAPIPKPEPEPKKVESKTLSDWPHDYREQFWKLYPRRVEKKAALAKLEAVRGTGLPWATLLGGVNRYVAFTAGKEQRYVKHPTVWLNKGCWDDELKLDGGGPNGPHPGAGGAGARPHGGHRSFAGYAVAHARGGGEEVD